MRRDARTPQEVLEEMMDDQPGSQCAGVDGSCDDRLVLVGEVKRLRAQLDAQQILIERQSLDAEDAVRYIEELEQERDDLRLGDMEKIFRYPIFATFPGDESGVRRALTEGKPLADAIGEAGRAGAIWTSGSGSCTRRTS